MDAKLNGEGVNVIWRYIALILISADITGFAGWVAFGWDSVKHSEIDYLMQTRAPYIHDKPKLESETLEQNRRLSDIELRLRELEKHGQ